MLFLLWISSHSTSFSLSFSLLPLPYFTCGLFFCNSSMILITFHLSHLHFWDGFIFLFCFFPEFNQLSFHFFCLFSFLIFDFWFKVVLHITNVCLNIFNSLDNILPSPFASWLSLEEEFQQLKCVNSHFSYFCGNCIQSYSVSRYSFCIFAVVYKISTLVAWCPLLSV